MDAWNLSQPRPHTSSALVVSHRVHCYQGLTSVGPWVYLPSSIILSVLEESAAATSTTLFHDGKFFSAIDPFSFVFDHSWYSPQHAIISAGPLLLEVLQTIISQVTTQLTSNWRNVAMPFPARLLLPVNRENHLLLPNLNREAIFQLVRVV